MNASELHIPVMLERCLELLAPAIGRPGAVVVDGTLGLGGHAEAMLERFPELTLVGLDRDAEALRLAGERLARFADRVHLVHTTYDGIDRAIAELGIAAVDGALYDLGVSSMQLDLPERGFSYAKDAPLDMRMDPTQELTAARIVAEYSERELARIFREYGEEKLAQRYAQRIVRDRATHPITRTGELVDLLQAATPAALSRQGHPAKRVFQALRIEVNQELAVLERAIPRAIDALKLGGRLVVMSYQSLEDRIVKRIFQARSRSTAPAGLPVELPEHRPELTLLTRGAELAGEEEKARNPRSAPVRLRAVERVREAA
ncbi:16S rRNA (cytosine(1402)-N(4))-methyltransferase RsmH [Gryllotalpicola ginsengisoli]|uniref:16S rRNA (cytosine(1402)-N(4))-methyltransferase RsmH n=1 Tax=Gryllotalpicola ginsengisoli TaxID=444608 RepID=UPI0003B5D8C4|nr:16S rRNA (cytosine(1402)-N(4))-methyltransferase RsmH [Gryllotalpicola ginsengisoli]